jgi:hypothetical protein
VSAVLAELAEPHDALLSGAVVDPDVGQQWQYDDVVENLSR